MDNIDNDLLTEILIRLPDCRHVAQCAAVCKRWSFLISDPQFIRSFVDHRLGSVDHSDSDSSSGHLALLLQKHDYEYGKLPIINSKYYQILFDGTSFIRTTSYLSFLPYDDVVIRAYFDDLLLVSRANADYAGSFSFCICNPMTNKWCELPEPPRPIVKLLKCAIVRRRSSENHHQGRSYSTYTVALMFYMTNGYLMARGVQYREEVWATVISSETGRWSPVATVPPPPEMRRWQNIAGRPRIFNQPVPCSNGVVHWLEGCVVEYHSVVAFDPFATPVDGGSRECRLIGFPAAEAGKESTNYGKNVRLGAYKGRLHLALLDDLMVLRVWELNEDCNDNNNNTITTASSCWSLVHNAAVEIMEFKVDLLALHPSNRNVVFLLADGTRIFRYDVSCRKADKVGHLPEQVIAGQKFTVYPLCP